MKIYLTVISLLFCCAAKAQSGSLSYGNEGLRGTIVACYGAPSASPNIQQFTVFGSNLTTPLDISAPVNFELSLSPLSGYQSSLTLNPVNSVVDKVTIYARAAAFAPVGNITGKCLISTSGDQLMGPVLSATIYTLPVVNNLPNQTLLSGKATQPINFTGTANTYTWVNDTPSIGLAASGTGDIPSFIAVNNGSQPVTATINVIAVAAGFAYVPNAGDGTVSVINTTSNKITASIPVGPQPYGITLSPDGSMAYVTNQGPGTVSVINTQTNTVVNTIKVGSSPGGLSINAGGVGLFVANENDNTFSYVNLVTGVEQATRPVGNQPVNTLVSHDDGILYVANSGSNTISVFNAFIFQAITTIPVGKSPSGMALSPDGSRLYVANSDDNTISVINTQLYTVTTTISLGTSLNPRGIVTSPDGSFLYVTNYLSNTVSVIDAVTNTLNATITVGKNPLGISITGDGTRLFVSNYGSNTMSVINTATNTVTATVPVGRGPTAFGNFLKVGTGCESTPVKVIITVNPPNYPTITSSGTPSGLSTIYGTPSTATTFTVSGANMVAGILVTPPAGFEVSADDVNFTGTVTIGTAGDIVATTVYIRLASSTPVGSYTGNIVLSSSAPAASVNVIMPVSTVTPAVLTIAADDKNRIFGAPNPVLTVTYNGFVNNDTPAKLTSQPKISTTAVNTSPAGQYPITASGAASPNYTFLYVAGVLTVIPPLFIPNTFTPNGDGINDKWEIQSLNSYMGCTVAVFNRYGQNVFSSTGYSTPWNGTYKGNQLPTGTYYYMIDLKNGSQLLSGFVAIVR